MVGLRIEIKGLCLDDESELKDESLLVVVALCQRRPKKELGGKTSEPRVIV